MNTSRAVIKEFKTTQGAPIRERVAREPNILKSGLQKNILHNIFCLRIDADEYEKASFSGYKNLFKKYKDSITIFFNVNSFKDAASEIKGCSEIGLDVQSHGFYHYTYNDYASNKHNIKKAKDFFLKLGIQTKGFASPMGKWNWPLMNALEDEGYEYSSDFSYDYLGLPSYPTRPGQRSSVLEIPIFPIAPELFYGMEFQKLIPTTENRQKIIAKRFSCQSGGFRKEDVVVYYKKAMDEMLVCNLPVIIYAHTSVQYNQIPMILEELIEYAIAKNLVHKNMSEIASLWKKSSAHSDTGAILKIPGLEYIGKEASNPFYARIKDWIKDYFDFERVTPIEELRGPLLRRISKRYLRKFLKRKGL